MTAEEFVPSTDDRIPSFGIIIRDHGVVLVFDEGTPSSCQNDVRVAAEKRFLSCSDATERGRSVRQLPSRPTQSGQHALVDLYLECIGGPIAR